LLRPRRSISKLKPVVHGGTYYIRSDDLRIPPKGIIDFSVNHNPYGPAPEVLAVVRSGSIDSYPDPEATELRNCLSKKLRVRSDNLIVGNGSTELIRLIAIAYFEQNDRVLIPQPTYGEYEAACQMMGAKVIRQPVLKEDECFRLDIERLIFLIRKFKPKGVFLCNPNNPTGQCVTCNDIAKLLPAFPDCLFIIDEAYITFAESEDDFSSLSLIHHNNLVILRSMTKDYALAGLRLGYAVAALPIIGILKKICPPWNVNTMAQLAGMIALRSQNYIEECKSRIRMAKGFLMTQLNHIGLAVIPSQANFFLVKVGDAECFYWSLLGKGFLVRDCTSFGLSEYIRIAPRALHECKRLVAAMKEVLDESATASWKSY